MSHLRDCQLAAHSPKTGLHPSKSADSVVQAYFESTTTHGLSRIYAARTVLGRLFWLAIFLTVSGFLVASLWQLAVKATSNEIVTVLQSQNNRSMQFPEVTFCNSNGFTKELNKDISKRPTTIDAEFDVSIHLSKLNDTEIRNFGHQQDIFLMTKLNMCLFKQSACNFAEDFLNSSSPFFGNCFTFKARGRSQNGALREKGLSVTININQDDYSSAFSQPRPAGVMVMIHHVNELYPSAQQLTLAPGTMTDIKLKKRVFSRLPDPFPDKCIDEETFLRKVHTRYSARICQNECYIRNQYEKCGSVTPLFESAVKMLPMQKYLNRGKLKVATSGQDFDCLSKFDDAFQNGEISCDCPPPCYEEQFTTSLSHSMWPALNDAEKILSDLKQSYGNQSAFVNWTKDKLYQNILKVNIYYQDFEVETIIQREAYSWNDFVCDLGGNISLWVGASVFSVIELGTFIGNAILWFVLPSKQIEVDSATKEDSQEDTK